MSTNLKPVAQPLRVHGFALERTGLVLAGKPSFDDWWQLGDATRRKPCASASGSPPVPADLAEQVRRGIEGTALSWDAVL